MPDNKEHKADKEISVWQKIEEILKEPSYKIAWKFDEAKKIDVKVNFKQFCIRNWAMERKIDLSSYKDSEITNNDFLKIGRKAVDTRIFGSFKVIYNNGVEDIKAMSKANYYLFGRSQS